MKSLLESFKRFSESEEPESKDTPLEQGKKYAICTNEDLRAGKCSKILHVTVGSDVPIEIIDERTSEEDGEKHYKLSFTKDDKSHVGWILASRVEGALKPFVEKEKQAPQPKKEKEPKQQKGSKKEPK
jgi:hypothetical protein